MKKLLILAAFVLLALSLTACKGEEAIPGDNLSTSAFTAAPASSEHDVQQGNSLSAAKDSRSPSSAPNPAPSVPTDQQEKAEMKWKVQIGKQAFTATPENNAATAALNERLREAPIVLHLRDYSGFEKVGPLGTTLPAEDSQTTTQAGDIVLYQSNQIVLFYGSNAWRYTRLGKIDDLTGWKEALGNGDVTITFSIEEE